MADSVSIAEYLAVLGYRVDEQSQRKFMDAVESMSKAVLGLSAGLVAAAGAVTASVAQMAGSSEKMYYLAQRIGDSVSDVDALAFAFSKLGLSPQEALSSITHMADEMRNNPAVRGIWQNITGSDHITAASLQKYSDFYRGLTTETQRAYRQMLGFGEEMHLAFLRGGPGGGVGEFNIVNRMFGFDPNQFAQQSVKMENAWRDLNLRLNAIWGRISSDYIDRITNGFNTVTAFIDAHATQIVAVITRAFKEIGDVSRGAVDLIKDAAGWFDRLGADKEEIIAILAAFGLLLANPGWVRLVAIATVLDYLLKDYAKFSETGQSAIPWQKISDAMTAIVGKLDQLSKATNGWVSVWTALEVLIGVRLVAAAVTLFGTVTTGAVTAGAAVTASLGGAFTGVLAIVTRLGPLLALLGLGQVGGELTPAEQNKVEQEHGYRRKQGVPLFDQFGQPIPGTSAPPSSAPPSATPNDQSGPGLITKMWRGFWDSIVGTAHAEELPDNVKALTRQMSDLNDTLTDMFTDQMVDMMQGGQDKLGAAMGGGSAGGGGGTGSPLNLNDPKVVGAVKFFMGKGWTLPQAIGIVSNLMAESGLNPGAENASGHVGVAQWDQKRQQDFRMLMGHPLKGSSLEEQEKFVDWELRNTEKGAGNDLSAMTNARASVASVFKNYERAGDSSLPRREGIGAALMRDPNRIINNTSNSSSGPSVEQHNNVTINAPSGDADEIMRAMGQANDRHYADIQRHLAVPLQ